MNKGARKNGGAAGSGEPTAPLGGGAGAVIVRSHRGPGPELGRTGLRRLRRTLTPEPQRTLEVPANPLLAVLHLCPHRVGRVNEHDVLRAAVVETTVLA